MMHDLRKDYVTIADISEQLRVPRSTILTDLLCEGVGIYRYSERAMVVKREDAAAFVAKYPKAKARQAA